MSTMGTTIAYGCLAILLKVIRQKKNLPEPYEDVNFLIE